MPDISPQNAADTTTVGSKRSPILTWGFVVSVGICVIFVMVAASYLKRMRESSGRLPCPTNLKQIGLAIHMYASANGGQFPDQMEKFLGPNGLSEKTFVCPSDDMPTSLGAHAFKTSYVYIGAGLTYQLSSDVVVAYDKPRNHAPDGSNVLMGDGHVEWLTARAMSYVLSEVAAGRFPVRVRPPTATSPTTTQPASVESSAAN